MARTYAQQKAALTRAEKKGPLAVLCETERAFKEWDDETGWPDGWARWENARLDAQRHIARERGTW